MFYCDKCGACCMNLQKSKLYGELDRGDGICIHFNVETKLCKIYDSRPDICNVDKMYQLCFANQMPLNQYYQLNHQVCILLKKKE